MSTATTALFQADFFNARRKVFKLLGGAFYLDAPDGSLLAYSKQKAFKLKEDIRVFADEAMSQPILVIQATKMIDWSSSYTVVDAQTGEHYGSLRRKGLKSMLRDSWEILDSQGTIRGKVTEDSGWKAIARRLHGLVALLMPQTFHILVGDKIVGTMAQNMNPFVQRFSVDLSHDTEALLPRPLAVATVILLLAIEGRQQGA